MPCLCIWVSLVAFGVIVSNDYQNSPNQSDTLKVTYFLIPASCSLPLPFGIRLCELNNRLPSFCVHAHTADYQKKKELKESEELWLYE